MATADEVALSNPLTSINVGPLAGGQVAVSTNLGGGNGWGFVETVSIPSPGHVAVKVQLTNNTGADATDVHWGVGFDPDQGRAVGLGNGTFNTINATGTPDSSVSAVTADGTMVTLANTTGTGAFNMRPYIDPASCCAPVLPGVMLATAQAAGSYGFSDSSINMGYDLHTIPAGHSATIGYGCSGTGNLRHAISWFGITWNFSAPQKKSCCTALNANSQFYRNERLMALAPSLLFNNAPKELKK